jgi:dihydrofolate reductase
VSTPIAVVIVAAIAENGVIGHDNVMPWRLPSDLKHFRTLTWGKPLIMGRRTFASIGKPLPGRTTVVVSRSGDFTAPGSVVAATVAAALEVARADALRRGADAIMVVGGAEIYAQAMPAADRLMITRIHASYAGDTFFPPIDPAQWREIERIEHAAGPQDSASFACVTYAREHAAATAPARS